VVLVKKAGYGIYTHQVDGKGQGLQGKVKTRDDDSGIKESDVGTWVQHLTFNSTCDHMMCGV